MEMKSESEISYVIIQGTDTCFEQVHTSSLMKFYAIEVNISLNLDINNS